MHEWLLSQGATLIYHFIEGGLMQESHIEEYMIEGEKRGYTLPIQPDKRDKPDKFGRIEANLQPAFELGILRISERLKGNKHFVNWKDQTLSFPTGHDDAPDATEGGLWIINQKVRTAVPASSGGQRRPTRY